MPSFTVLLHNVHSYNRCLRKSSLWQQMENILHLDSECSGEHLAAKVLQLDWKAELKGKGMVVRK